MINLFIIIIIDYYYALNDKNKTVQRLSIFFFIKYLLRNTNVTEHMPRKRARGSSMAKQYTVITNQKRKSEDQKIDNYMKSK